MPKRAQPAVKISAVRRRWLNQQVMSGRFATLDDAIDFCVRRAAELDAAEAEFDRLIAEGDQGPFERVNAAWWSRLRAESDTRQRARTRRKSA